MGRRERRAAARAGKGGKGSTQRRKEHQLGIEMSGISKPMLDAMNSATLEVFGVGIGVCVQEEDRAKKIVASLLAERDALPKWRLAARHRLKQQTVGHRREAELWSGRIRRASEIAAGQASERDLARAATQR